MPFLNQIGDSIEVRIPEALIQQAGLANTELEFAVVEDGLLIKPVRSRVRQGWEKQIREAILAHGNEIVDAEWLDAPLLDEDFDG
ncbi:MAG: AbrB/MazE/SpoVT family DNA-binding domain-containing protein [Anaerolineaceae bacterium]|nr:AbrB/MazE/SpoVT family DNA-binding domain-containing protein [Anaerolineaceae bacterium]